MLVHIAQETWLWIEKLDSLVNSPKKSFSRGKKKKKQKNTTNYHKALATNIPYLAEFIGPK